MVRIASIRPPCRLRAERSQGRPISPVDYLQDVLKGIDEAADAGATVVAAPEDVLFMMQAGYAESQQGPVHTALLQKAKSRNITLLVGLVLRDGNDRYNAYTIFQPDGIAGVYRKTHLTKLENSKYEMTAGNDLPVFNLPFGRVGVMTCSDILFPEVARVLALNGAQIIFFPHQMAEPNERFFRTMLQSRAQDNCVHIVSSNFADEPGRGWYRNYIVAPNGDMVAEGPVGEGFVVADLEINSPVSLRDYIEVGPIDLRQIVNRYRRPELYDRIARRGIEP